MTAHALCRAQCRSGVQLCDASCPSVTRMFDTATSLDGAWHRCSRSAIWFQDLRGIDDVPLVALRDGGDGVTVAEQLEHRQRFGASIRMTAKDDTLYPSVGYVGDDLREGLFLRVEEILLAHAGLAAGASLRILEVGCASGFLLERLHAAYPATTVVGVDPSPVSCEQANARRGVIAHCGTLDTVDVGGEQFDIVVMIGNLMLHPNPERSLRLVAGHVRPGGTILFDVKNPNSSARVLGRWLSRGGLLRRFRRIPKVLKHSWHGMRYGLPRSWLTAVVADLGLEVVALRSRPPRLLEFSNRNELSRGLFGLAWRATNMWDRVRDERAWLEVVCRRPATSRVA